MAACPKSIGDLDVPLNEGTYEISSGWGPREGGFHYGIDFAAELGTPIHSPGDGVVHYCRNMSGYGSAIVITIETSKGVVDVLMGHMKLSDAKVKEGDRVTRGQLLSKTGTEGDSSGPHVHCSIFDDLNWNYTSEAIDPTPFFGV